MGVLVTIDDMLPFFPRGYFEDSGENFDRFNRIARGVEAFIRNYTNNDFTDRGTGRPVYPPDVKLGAINLVKWELNDRRDKAGIASETLSRHSVSYVNDSDSAAADSYPGSLLGFLKPYKRARF